MLLTHSRIITVECKEHRATTHQIRRTSSQVIQSHSSRLHARLTATDCLAASGSEIHEAAREEISETFQSIDEKINALSEASSATLGRVDSLYDNIAYPLSATLCHSDKRVQATITEHLSNMHNELNSASDKLKALHAQWQECVHTEQKMWQEFTDSDDSTVNTRDDFGTHERKVKTIAQNAAKELDNLDAVSRHAGVTSHQF